MKELKYEIPIYPDNNPKVFKAACARLERAYPRLKKGRLLVDVDGSTIQIYRLDGKEIIIYDDYDVGAVVAMADVDISAALRRPIDKA